MADAVREILKVIQGDIAGVKGYRQGKCHPGRGSRQSTMILIACSVTCPRLRSAST